MRLGPPTGGEAKIPRNPSKNFIKNCLGIIFPCRAKAEAEKMAKKADAWKEYKEAATLDMVLEALPKVAAEVAAPLSQAKKITMVADASGEVGASR